MTSSQANAVELLRRGGAVPSSEWTTGHGRHISKRPVPVGCKLVDADQVAKLAGETKKAAMKLLRDRPRIQRLVVVHDRRKVARLARLEQAEVQAAQDEVAVAAQFLSEKSEAEMKVLASDPAQADEIAAWIALPESQRHPAPARIHGAKIASGLGWRAFEREAMKMQGAAR